MFGSKLVRFVMATFFITLLISAANAHSQVLWNGAEFGMTVQQIQKLFPKAIRPDDPNHLGTDSAAVEGLRLNNVEIGGEKFSAQFYFNKENKLDQVTLAMNGAEDWTSSKLAFDHLSDALTSKYGKALSEKFMDSPLNWAERNWMTGRVNVNLLAIAVNGEGASLPINYQVRVAKDADKL